MVVREFTCANAECSEIVSVDHKHVLNHFGMVYCDECKAEGFVDGTMEDKEEEKLAINLGRVLANLHNRMERHNGGY